MRSLFRRFPLLPFKPFPTRVFTIRLLSYSPMSKQDVVSDVSHASVQSSRRRVDNKAIKTLLSLNTDSELLITFSKLIYGFLEEKTVHLDYLKRVLVLCSSLSASNRPNSISTAVIAYIENHPDIIEYMEKAKKKLEKTDYTPEDVLLIALDLSGKDGKQTVYNRRRIIHDIAKIREGLFKSFAVVGIPKAINGLTCFKTISQRYPILYNEMEKTFQSPDYYPKISSDVAIGVGNDIHNNSISNNNNNNNNNILDNIPKHASQPQVLSMEEQRLRGIQLFDSIYGKNTLKLKRILDGLHPLFLDCIIDESYGRVLGEMCVIGVLETELVMYSALKSQGGLVERQATSHMLGAKKFGATDEQIFEIDYIIDELLKIPVPLTD